MYTVTGIDVSDYQGDVHWATVKASGRSFAFIKATEGTDFIAKTFMKNWHAAKDAGLIRGAYHFGHPGKSATEQADFFVRIVERQGYGAGDLPLVLDLETDDGLSSTSVATWTQTFLTRVEQLTGRKPILYTGAFFYKGPNKGWPLWLPSYFNTPLSELHTVHPKLPPGFKTFAFWQHTSSMVVPGVTGRCDHNVFNGSLDQLKKLAAVPKPAGLTLGQRLKKAGLGVKSVANILKKLGR
jgi:lysozyme